MIEWVVGKVFEIIPVLSELRKTQRELADEAITTISDALTETSIYVTHIGNGGEPDTVKQAELARLWARAAIPIRHIDQELSEICENKSKYWIDPGDWPSDLVREKGIGLHQVRDRYSELRRNV